MYLVFGVGLEQENVHHGELARMSVLLKLLSQSGPDVRGGHGDVVHGLDLGGLISR